MDKWMFGFLGLLFGVALAVLIDRMRFKRGCGPEQRERNRWLTLLVQGPLPHPRGGRGGREAVPG